MAARTGLQCPIPDQGGEHIVGACHEQTFVALQQSSMRLWLAARPQASYPLI